MELFALVEYLIQIHYFILQIRLIRLSKEISLRELTSDSLPILISFLQFINRWILSLKRTNMFIGEEILQNRI